MTQIFTPGTPPAAWEPQAPAATKKKTAAATPAPAANPQAALASQAASAAPASTNPQSVDQLTQQLQQINPLALQLFNNKVLLPWMQQLQGQQQNINQQYMKDESNISNQPYMKGNKQAAAMDAQIPQTNANASLLMSSLGRDVMATPSVNEAATNAANIQASLQQDIAQRQKLAAYQDPTYQVLAQQAQSGISAGTSSPAYIAAQQAGASPTVLQAILAAGSSSSLPGVTGASTTLPAPTG